MSHSATYRSTAFSLPDVPFLGSKNELCFNGKEKDYESGFHYYGARYYWSESLTGWLSVDPLADKYPGISPYAYCAWNPVKLVDPDGEFPVKVHEILIMDFIENYPEGVRKGLIYGVGTNADYLHPMANKVHFDGMSGFDNIASAYSGIIDKYKEHFTNGKYKKAGMELHAIADFYSHSNYIDLYNQYAQEAGIDLSKSGIPVFSEAMDDESFKTFAESHGGLKTGSFNVVGWVIYDKILGKPKPGSHGEMNLDDAASPQGSKVTNTGKSYYEAAIETARKEMGNVINYENTEL